AAGGAGLEACAEAARAAIERTNLVYVLDTLEYLQRGGRVGRARAWLGNVFNIKPVLTGREGEGAPLGRGREGKRADEKLFELTTAHANAERVAVAHSSSPDEAERWAARLRERFPGVPVETTWLGPVVGVYAGPGVLGMAVSERPVESGNE